MGKLNIENTLNEIKDIIEEADCYVIVTNKGLEVNGTGVELLTCLASLVNSLKNQGFDEDRIKEAIELGLKDKEEVERETTDKIKKIIGSGDKDTIKELIEALTEFAK